MKKEIGHLDFGFSLKRETQFRYTHISIFQLKDRCLVGETIAKVFQAKSQSPAGDVTICQGERMLALQLLGKGKYKP